MIDVSELQSPGTAALCFRGILDAFAKPGTTVKLAALQGLPEGLNAASAAVALSLCDFQTPIWLSPSLNHKDVRHFLRFHTGAPIVEEIDKAAFALAVASEFASIYAQIHKGTQEYPDRSATAIVQVSQFVGPQRVRLQGPGIQSEKIISVAGFGPKEWNLLSDDRILFPLGVDVALTCETALTTIPRSTRITCLEDR